MKTKTMEISKENLEKISKGMIVKTNSSKDIFEVKATSKNFVIIANKDKYSIISKKPCEYKYNYDYNKIDIGDFYFGSDDYIFGCPLSNEYEDLYNFDNEEANEKYLQLLEEEKVEISMRNRCKLKKLTIVEQN